jgi:hypothetical protein
MDLDPEDMQDPQNPDETLDTSSWKINDDGSYIYLLNKIYVWLFKMNITNYNECLWIL